MAKLVLFSLRRQAFLSVCFPLAAVVILSLPVSVFSIKFSCSLLGGGIVWGVSQGYLAIKLFRRIETDPGRFVVLFYISEMIKLILAALLFILILKWTSASFIFLLAGYLCAQILFVFVIVYFFAFRK